MNKDTLEQRRQLALRIANQCLQILKEEFNAKEAILFASLRGDSPTIKVKTQFFNHFNKFFGFNTGLLTV